MHSTITSFEDAHVIVYTAAHDGRQVRVRQNGVHHLTVCLHFAHELARIFVPDVHVPIVTTRRDVLIVAHKSDTLQEGFHISASDVPLRRLMRIGISHGTENDLKIRSSELRFAAARRVSSRYTSSPLQLIASSPLDE